MKNKIKSSFSLVIISGLVLGISLIPNAHAVVPRVNTLISVNNTGDGQGGNNHSPATTGSFQISGNGKFVAFSSLASNLVANDTNGLPDVFLRDLSTNTTTRVSVSSSGVQGNGALSGFSGGELAISETGRYVAFASQSTNLIDGETISTGHSQIYIRDTKTNTTSLVTQKSDGTVGNGSTILYGVSNDGRFVTWRGHQNTNLTAGGTASTYGNVYVADLKTRTFTLVNAGLSGAEVAMSCDGSFMSMSTTEALDSNDTDTLNDVYLIDIRNGFTKKSITSVAGADPTKYANGSSISCNGNFITFRSNDPIYDPAVSSTDTKFHIYKYDRINETTSIVDATTTGTVADGTGTSQGASVDNNGNVAFISSNTVIQPSTIPAQLYLKHAETGLLERVSLTSAGGPSNGVDLISSISADGKKVVFSHGASASTLLGSGGDTNGYTDVLMSLTGL